MRYIFLLVILLAVERLCAQGFVVIELFTSQGCSSCPAADKNLSEIIQRAEREGKPVYGLSFHVDYWNYIGWKDPYSSKEFTERQRKYSKEMGSDGVYTPQMIVNGESEFVGSQKGSAEKAIEEALKKKPSFQILISDLEVIDDRLRLRYTIDKSPGDETVNVAVVERDVENYVARGENSGKTLHHDNVVREFKSFPLQRQGQLEIKIPPLNSTKTSVILFIQDKHQKILSASVKPIS